MKLDSPRSVRIILALWVGTAICGCPSEECSTNADCAAGTICAYGGTCTDPTQNQPDAGATDASTGGDGSIIPTNCGNNGSSAFNPEEVYLWGTLQEGACYRDAIAAPATPNDERVGFSCDADSDYAIVRPSDGLLIYPESGTPPSVRVFSPDAFTWDADLEECIYPDLPADNDAALITAGCDYVWQIFINAEDSTVIYNCNSARGLFLNSAGDTLLDLGNDALLSWGYQGYALIAPYSGSGSEGLEVTDSSGTATPVTGIATGNVLTTRAHGSGFFVAVETDTGTNELWNLAFDATANLVAVYPDPPAGMIGMNQSKLNSFGDLYAFSRDGMDDTIVRLGRDGSSSTVYNEADDPDVKIHISSLVTGP